METFLEQRNNIVKEYTPLIDSLKQRGYINDNVERAHLYTIKDLEDNYETEADEDIIKFNKEEHVKQLKDKDLLLYNFVTSLDDGILPSLNKDENVQTSSWYNWFGIGADSKVTMNGIINRVSSYSNEFFKDTENKTIEVGKRYYQELVNSSMFINTDKVKDTKGLYRKTVTDEDILDNEKLKDYKGQYCYYKDGQPLFIIERYNSDDKIKKHGNQITLFKDDNATSLLIFSQMYNQFPNEAKVTSLFRDGADKFQIQRPFGAVPINSNTEQWGDMFEEIGDMLDNVRDYSKKELKGIYNGIDKKVNVNFVPIYDSSMGSAGNFATMLKHEKELDSGKYNKHNSKGEVTRNDNNYETDINKTWLKYMNDLSKTNIADLTMYLPKGNKFKPDADISNEPYEIVTDTDLKTNIRGLLTKTMSDGYDKSGITIQFGKIGNTYGYMLNCPRPSKKSIFGENKLNNIQVFIPNFFDIEEQNEYTSRPDVQAEMAITSSILNEDSNQYRQTIFPQIISLDGNLFNINSDYIPTKTDKLWQNVKYNVTKDGENIYTNVIINGEKYNLDNLLNDNNRYEKLNAMAVLQDYLTLCLELRNFNTIVYNGQVHGKVAYLGQDKTFNNTEEKIENVKDDKRFKYLTSYLNGIAKSAVNKSGLNPLQLLTIFENPELAKDIQNFENNELVKAAMTKQLIKAQAAIGKYYW